MACWLLINSKRKHSKLSLTSLFLIIHFYAYFVFIWLSISFIDASVPLEYRTLFPVYLNFLVLIACQLGGVVLEGNKPILRYLVPVLGLVLFTGTLKTTWQMRTEGIGYNASVWQTFEFTNVIKNIDAGLVHTNDKAAVLYYADNIREVRILPEIKSLYSLKENPLFDRQMGAVNTTLMVDEANYIIWVRNGITADVYPSYEALKSNKIYEVVYDDWLCLVLKYNFLK